VRLVGWLLAGHREPPASSRVREVAVPGGTQPDAIVWRQGAALAISSTPGSVVTGIYPDAGTLQLDQLVHGWPDLDDRVAQ